MIDKYVLSVKVSYLPVTKNLSERREGTWGLLRVLISKGNETSHLAGQLYQGQCEWETNDRNATQSWVSRLHDPLGTMLKPGSCKRTQAALGIPALWRFLQPGLRRVYGFPKLIGSECSQASSLHESVSKAIVSKPLVSRTLYFSI